jgi:hypothetical protein
MEMWERAAALKLPVFPCHSDKTPACPHGFKDAQREPNLIRQLFESYPGELVGMPTGEISGVDVLDLDLPRHAEARAWLAQAHLPETRMHQTRSGGQHYFYRHYPGLRNWTSRPVAGVDGRADGGYVIFWPQAGHATNLKPVIEWPRDLLRIIKPKPRAQASQETASPVTDQKFNGVLRAVGNAINGERNELLFWGACRFAEWIEAGGITRSVGETVLTSAARRSGLDDIEIAKTIASAFNREARNGNPAQ